MKTRAKEIAKKTACILFLTAVVSYLAAACFLFADEPDTICNSISVKIKDGDKYNFINENDITGQLAKKKLSPAGRKVSHALADSIEESINSISFVKTSECYIGDDGKVYIEVEQRQPVLLVKSARSNYYIDSERKRIPVSKHCTALVPIVTGNVTESAAKNEIFDFVSYIKADKFYRNHIDQIMVERDGTISLGVKKGVPVIKLGVLDNYDEKLAKLLAWYEQYPAFAWGDKYRTVDLSYSGLIYCTLNGK